MFTNNNIFWLEYPFEDAVTEPKVTYVQQDSFKLAPPSPKRDGWILIDTIWNQIAISKNYPPPPVDSEWNLPRHLTTIEGSEDHILSLRHLFAHCYYCTRSLLYHTTANFSSYIEIRSYFALISWFLAPTDAPIVALADRLCTWRSHYTGRVIWFPRVQPADAIQAFAEHGEIYLARNKMSSWRLSLRSRILVHTTNSLTCTCLWTNERTGPQSSCLGIGKFGSGMQYMNVFEVVNWIGF